MTPRTLLLGLLAAAVLVAVPAALPAVAMTSGTPVTDPNTAPWVATLAYANGSALVPDGAPLLQRATCGGALVTPTRVLTAAHCLDGQDPSQLEVHVNARTLSTDPGVVRHIAGVSVLPGYRLLPSPADPRDTNLDSARNDLAIIRLDHPVTSVPPIPVADSVPAAGSAVAMFSHGSTGESGADFRDDQLHRGDLTVISHPDCQSQTPATVDAGSITCAEDRTTGVNACYQDSGSPIVGYSTGRAELVGVMSFGGETAGKPCADTPEPVAFTTVPTFRSFSYGPITAREPYPATQPTVTGTAAVGTRLRCQPPAWDPRHGDRPDSIRYGWATVTRSGYFAVPTPIPGATGRTFTPAARRAGQSVTCTVQAANPAGTVMAIAAPVTVDQSSRSR